MKPARAIDDRPLREVRVQRAAAGTRTDETDLAAVEEPLQVLINGTPFAVVMRTPGADRDLAAGFLIGERIVADAADVHAIEPVHSRDGRLQHNVVDVRVSAAAEARVAAVTRAVTTNASCGLCGRQNVLSLVADGLVVRSDLTIAVALAADLPARMRAAQAVFDRTGGLHAAALFTADGTMLHLAEDVGRHNAVDKVVGARWWAGELPLSTRVLCVSGRLSYEIVLKALIAGIPLIVAVSAPSTLAIDLAEGGGMTLAGFVRDGRMNVYCHGGRLRQA